MNVQLIDPPNLPLASVFERDVEMGQLRVYGQVAVRPETITEAETGETKLVQSIIDRGVTILEQRPVETVQVGRFVIVPLGYTPSQNGVVSIRYRLGVISRGNA
jgi:hypothetical protein